MLVLTRKPTEKIRIGNDIYLTIVKVDGNKVRIGIEAPSNVSIQRQELIGKSSFVDQKSLIDSKLVTDCLTDDEQNHGYLSNSLFTN